MYYYTFHLGDYIKETAHLSLIEDIIYRRLIDYYFDKEEAIPNKTQWVSRRLRLGSESKKLEAILQEFFTLEGDGRWHQKRCDKEIGDYRKKREVARANGSKGGRPSKPRKTQSVILANPEKTKSKANRKPITVNQEPLSSCQGRLPTDDDIKLARFMYKKIVNVVTYAKEPNYESWGNTIRLMRERDKLTHKEIQDIFVWANNDSFWNINIRSPETLRSKFPELYAKSKKTKRGDKNEQFSNKFFNQFDKESSGLQQQANTPKRIQPEISDIMGEITTD